MLSNHTTLYYIHISKKENKSVSIINILWDKEKSKKDFKVLSCVIYTIINNYVCIDILACESKKLSELNFGCRGILKHTNKNYDTILGIGIPDLSMNFMSCHGFLKEKHYVVVLKCPKRMLEKYFSKGFTLLE